jgi:hypothetical protein
MTKDLKDRIVEYSDTISRLLSEKADATARATAAEARVAVLEGLMTQARPYLEAAANDYLKCPLTGSPEEAQILVASIGRAET